MNDTGPRAFLCALVCISIVAGGVGPAAATPPQSEVVAPDTATETITYRLLPSRPGYVEMELSYEVGHYVDYLNVNLPSNARVKPGSETPGFEADSGGEGMYDWDRESRTARLTVIAAVNQRGANGYDSFAGSDWALFEKPYVISYYQFDGEIEQFGMAATRSLSRARFEGDGHSTQRFVYVGPHSTRTIEADGQTIDVVIPEAADVSAEWDEVEAALRFGKTALADWENTPGSLTIFVAPEPFRLGGSASGSERWGYTMWVHQDVPAVDSRSAWLHEYAHLHQGFAVGEDSRMKWIVEGSAEYYAALLSYRHGAVSSEAFYREIHDVPGPYRSVVLAEESEWSQAQYDKGGRVLAALDVKIRQETDGERSLATVMRRMNTHEGEVTYEDFRRIVVDVGGESLGAWTDEYVLTSALPPFDGSLDVSGTTDEDGDGLTGSAEAEHGSNPYLVNSDRDSLNDSTEARLGTDPLSRDTDDDGVDDAHEYHEELDPLVQDTDGDGVGDGEEIFPYLYTDTPEEKPDRERQETNADEAESDDSNTRRLYGIERILHDAGLPSGLAARSAALVVPVALFLAVVARIVS